MASSAGRKRSIDDVIDSGAGKRVRRASGEEEGDHVTMRRSRDDPVFISDDRVVDNMLRVEDRFVPSATYFACVQRDVEPWMRNKVSMWMLEVTYSGYRRHRLTPYPGE